jgi:hypothetical protein
MKSRTYTPISRESFDRIKEALHQGGADDAGVLRMHGVEVLYVFSEDAKCLSVSLQHKPWLVPDSAVWNTVERAIQPYLGTPEETRTHDETSAPGASNRITSAERRSAQERAQDSHDNPEPEN